ncbi:MAG: response regulator, partial [Leptospiraceae bacterium]|nr:response regulator [Leptospiraceae bacterium]
LLGIINDILDYSKIEAGKMELHESIFDIHHALEELVFPYVQLSKKSSLTVSYKIHPDVPRYILGDLLRLKQVLNNFLSNAIKFTEKGYIMLSLKVDEIEGENVVLHFQVKDSGIGLSKKQISNIFTPFIQADSSITKKYGGTGLGLSICKKISDIMGGKIYVDSIPGRGSIFHFIVSLSVRKKIDDFQIIAGLEEDASNLHILLAEDNAVNQAVCKHILNKSGHRVTVVSSGLEAVRLIKEERRFNLILMDISMPDMDGLTALSHIRELEGSRNLYTPVIVLTAYALQGDREKFLELGADDYLSKPYSGEELQRLIRKFSKGVKNFCELDE